VYIMSISKAERNAYHAKVTQEQNLLLQKINQRIRSFVNSQDFKNKIAEYSKKPLSETNINQRIKKVIESENLAKKFRNNKQQLSRHNSASSYTTEPPQGATAPPPDAQKTLTNQLKQLQKLITGDQNNGVNTETPPNRRMNTRQQMYIPPNRRMNTRQQTYIPLNTNNRPENPTQIEQVLYSKKNFRNSELKQWASKALDPVLRKSAEKRIFQLWNTWLTNPLATSTVNKQKQRLEELYKISTNASYPGEIRRSAEQSYNMMKQSGNKNILRAASLLETPSVLGSKKVVSFFSGLGKRINNFRGNANSAKSILTMYDYYLNKYKNNYPTRVTSLKRWKLDYYDPAASTVKGEVRKYKLNEASGALYLLVNGFLKDDINAKYTGLNNGIKGTLTNWKTQLNATYNRNKNSNPVALLSFINSQNRYLNQYKKINSTVPNKPVGMLGRLFGRGSKKPEPKQNSFKNFNLSENRDVQRKNSVVQPKNQQNARGGPSMGGQVLSGIGSILQAATTR